MLSLLQHEGPATSAALARRLGESTGATSYHLRQLARYGLIEEEGERGNGRQRWWRAAARHYDVDPELVVSDDYAAVTSRLLTRVLERDAAVISSYVENHARYDRRWRAAATFTNHVIYATPEEIEATSVRIRELLRELERPDPAERPAGAERVYGVVGLVPWRPEIAGA